MKSGRSKTISPQQASFELRNRVFLAMNKLADRDTQRIGVEELDKIVENSSSESIPSLLSCLTETDSEQKTAVRRECVRLIGSMTKLHGAFLSPHLGKIISSIKKRIRDPDTVVREVCAETVGLLARHLERDTVVSILIKPLSEALGEQNRNAQMGAAMCLSTVFHEARGIPSPLLQQILSRAIKLLKNPHFMAKPALLDLIRSIVQAGGASSKQTLSLALNSIQEGLKNSEWITRKAAASALLELAENADRLSGGLWPWKGTITQSLERSRFDRVKPVRDASMEALNCWKSVSEFDPQEVKKLQEESEGSCVTKSFDGARKEGRDYVYEDSATSDLVDSSVETKNVIVMRDSVQSNVNCSSELTGIGKRLEEIERLQSSLMDLLQGFTQNSMDSLSELKSKVNSLEILMDTIAQNSSSRNSYSNKTRPMAKTSGRSLKNMYPSLVSEKADNDKLYC